MSAASFRLYQVHVSVDRKMRIVFMGTPQAAVPSLQRIVNDGHEVVCVWTQPDKPAGRGDRIRPSPIKEFALSRALPVEQPSRIKTDEAKSLFASYGADLAVVVAYGRILPSEFLQAPKRGCINVHFSLLPQYRGAAPTNWAIVKGESQTGVTTMLIEEALDSGPILMQRETAIGDKETAPELMGRLSLMGAELLSETLLNLDHLTPRPQNDANATFAPMLTRADGLIKWTDSAINIERAVRGFQPWPNAYSSYRGRRVILHDAQPEITTEVEQTPGEVIVAHGDDLVVKAGDNSALRIFELQAEAKRRMNVRDFINGLRLKVGDRFGED